MQVIIDTRFLKVYDSFKTQILVDLTRIPSDNEGEVDINWFVWKDLIGDTVIESRNEVIKVMNSLMRGECGNPWERKSASYFSISTVIWWIV